MSKNLFKTLMMKKFCNSHLEDLIEATGAWGPSPTMKYRPAVLYPLFKLSIYGIFLI